MKLRLSILYSWLVRMLTAWLPDVPVCMRLRGLLYSLMMKKCGRNLQVTSTAIFNSLSGISMGSNVFIAHRVVIIATDLETGDEVLIGPGSVISGGNHTYLNGSYRYGKHRAAPVKLGRGAWVGANCSITAGAVLPPRSVLAAGAVLTHAYTETDCVYAGVPAKPIKKIERETDER